MIERTVGIEVKPSPMTFAMVLDGMGHVCAYCMDISRKENGYMGRTVTRSFSCLVVGLFGCAEMTVLHY